MDTPASEQIGTKQIAGRDTASSGKNVSEAPALTEPKAESGENKKAPALAEGYTTESGRPLSEADEKEFILHNGEINFGMIDKTIADATGGELKEAPIRLQVGNGVKGLVHAKKHNDDAVKAGYKSIEDFIADVAANFDRIYKRVNKIGNDTYILVKTRDRNISDVNSVAPIYFEITKDKDGGFYNIISAIPKRDSGLRKEIKKESLIYSSPALDAATISNDSAVSISGSNNVGATQEGQPTSDRISNSSKAIVSQEAKGSKQQLKKTRRQARQALKTALDKIMEGARQAKLPQKIASAWRSLLRARAIAYDPYDPARMFEEHPLVVRNDTKDFVDYAQSAWHGSPYKFDKFDLGKIGTGEGQQVHGWGLYFAKNRKVSEEYYRDRLSAGKNPGDITEAFALNIKYKDGTTETVTRKDNFDFLADWTKADGTLSPLSRNFAFLDYNNMDIQATLDFFRRELRDLMWRRTDMISSGKYSRSKFKEVEAAIKEYQKTATFFKSVSSITASDNNIGASLYEVEIPNDDVLLDEGKTLKDQPAKVREAIRKLNLKYKTEQYYIIEHDGKKYRDPLNNTIYFAPGNTETVDKYTLLLIAGQGNNGIEDIRVQRVLGLLLADKTITNPWAIVCQKNGRVVTSTLTADKKGDKKAALRELKKRISGADEVLYIWEGLTRRPRPSADQRASQSDAKLHPSGTSIIAQETGNSKAEASKKSESARKTTEKKFKEQKLPNIRRQYEMR